MTKMEPFDIVRNVAAVVGSLYLLKVVVGELWSLAGGIYGYILAPWGITRTNLKKYGQWAVVTGGSEGIGRGYALELARQGLNVVIMSRSEEKLQKVASEIREKYRREVLVIAVDFSAGQDIYPQIAEKLSDLDIGILVNNVGLSYEFPDFFTDVSEIRFRMMLELNCQSLVQMTRLLLPKMVEKKRGAIINISSSGGDFPIPLLTVYSASKTFVTNFSAALRKEYEAKGIVVQNVKPYFVATAMSGIRRANVFTPSPETYTRSAVATIGVQKNTFGYWAHGLQGYVVSWMPVWLRYSVFWRAMLAPRARGLKKRARQAKEQ